MQLFRNLRLYQQICYYETATVSVFVDADVTHNIIGHLDAKDQACTFP